MEAMMVAYLLAVVFVMCVAIGTLVSRCFKQTKRKKQPKKGHSQKSTDDSKRTKEQKGSQIAPPPSKWNCDDQNSLSADSESKMKRRQFLPTDSDMKSESMTASPNTPNTMKCKSKMPSLSKTVSILPSAETLSIILPSVVLRRIAALMLVEVNKETGKADRESLINRIRIAGTNSTLRQCVLKHNQATAKHQLRVSLNETSSVVGVDGGEIKCFGDAIEQVKAALNFFCPNDLLLVFKEPPIEQAKYLLNAFGDMDMSTVKTRKMKLESTTSVGQQVLSCLSFAQRLTHIQIELSDDDRMKY